MFKMIIHVTQEFETLVQCQNAYNAIVLDLAKNKDLHINGQVTTKFTGYSPENPNGHEVQP